MPLRADAAVMLREARERSRATRRTHMMADVNRILRLTPEERIREVAAVSRFVSSARRV